MKKPLIFVFMCVLTLIASAQPAKLQSAISDLRNERLGPAKKNIDEACLHERTISDPKTWYYAGAIYCKIIEISNTNPKKFEKQKITMSMTELTQTAKQAIVKSMALEKEQGTRDFSASNVQNLNYLGSEVFNMAVDPLSSGKWEEALPYLTEVIEIAQISGNRQILQQAQLYAGQSYEQMKDTVNAKELYRAAVRSDIKEEAAYINLYSIYRAELDTVKAANVIKRGAKNLPKNFKILSLLASVQVIQGDVEAAEKTLNMVIELDPNNHLIHNAVGSVLQDAQRYDEAKVSYEKSLALNANQYEAYFGLAGLYNNKAADLLTEAAQLPMEEVEKYEALENEAKSNLREAIPLFKKALEYKEKDFYSLIGLRNIYSKLEMTEEYKQIKEILDAME